VAGPPGAKVQFWTESLEHAEHDGADEGESDIRGYNAQFADEWHGRTPLVHVVPAHNALGSKAFPAEKVSVAVGSRHPHRARSPATWLKISESNALKSP
jgi:hypothetical protein